ncbi:NAD(P)-dependent oxidoreductase [Streptomyces sp. NPDC014685]|uniref:NAD(P)-dependent oxidoreductase n=1 Tax=Streptomyces sp. NPDC014685 TaxID=3364881 RepID=UPI0036F79AEF
MPDKAVHPPVRVAVVSPIGAPLLAWLRERSEVDHRPRASQADLPGLTDPQVVVLRSNVTLGAAELAAMPHLRLVVRTGSGTDNICLGTLAARGIDLVRTGGEPSAPAVAELALQSALTLLRRVPLVTAALRAGDWAKNTWLGEELAGSCVGVWGAGPVGRAVEKVFTAVGATVLYADHASVPSASARAAPHELAARAGLHVFALPHRPETTGYVDQDLLRAFGPRRPHLVNVGRWELFDMPAVLAALESGMLSGVSVDPVDLVHMKEAGPLAARAADPRRPLNLQLTPHVGATTEAAYARVSATTIGLLEERWPRLFPSGNRSDPTKGAR